MNTPKQLIWGIVYGILGLICVIAGEKHLFSALIIISNLWFVSVVITDELKEINLRLRSLQLNSCYNRLMETYND